MPTLLSIEALEQDRLFVKRKLDEVAANPWGTARLMWESRLVEIDKQILELVSKRSNYASVALMFDGGPVFGSSDIRLDFATNALDSYQKVITLCLASKLSEELPQRGTLPGADRSRLFIRDIARGSVGFILEEIAPEQHEMLPTSLKNAVEGATSLISTLSGSEETTFEQTLENTQPRLVAAVQKFAKVLYDFGASTKIFGDENRLTLSIEEVGLLSRRLSEIQVSEEIETVSGILLGILPESRQFELKPSDGDAQTIKGAISEELASKYTADLAFRDQHLLRPITAQIKHIRTIRNGRLVREQLILEAVEPI